MQLNARTLAIAMALSAASAYGQANAGWGPVQRLESGRTLRIKTVTRVMVCDFVHADEVSVTCAERRGPFRKTLIRNLGRLEVRWIKASRDATSTLAGAGIGAGVGVAIGAGVDASAKNQAEEGHLVTVMFGFLGAVVGTAAGAHTDFLAGPLIYNAP